MHAFPLIDQILEVTEQVFLKMFQNGSGTTKQWCWLSGLNSLLATINKNSDIMSAFGVFENQALRRLNLLFCILIQNLY